MILAYEYKDSNVPYLQEFCFAGPGAPWPRCTGRHQSCRSWGLGVSSLSVCARTPARAAAQLKEQLSDIKVANSKNATAALASKHDLELEQKVRAGRAHAPGGGGDWGRITGAEMLGT